MRRHGDIGASLTRAMNDYWNSEDWKRIWAGCQARIDDCYYYYSPLYSRSGAVIIGLPTVDPVIVRNNSVSEELCLI